MYQTDPPRPYEPIALLDQRFWLEEIELGLGLWQGTYQQTTGLWLRWYNSAGWVLTLKEQAQQERQRADRLAEYLRRCEAACRQTSQGIDPDNLS